MKPSERDIAYFQTVEALKRQSASPMVGDFVRLKDGRLKRIAHIWGDGDIQLCDGGSFYLNASGSCSMSGSLDSSLQLQLELVGVHRGLCWRFADGIAGAGRGVDFVIDFNLFTEVA